ncbi:diguanylate cyclase domain-containing protein [Sporomusa sp.]|uniref:diguanylate cyclase domain-containing protein n=1 Tax=Sporomusa sp. TaxID=2078658 RepID=UPI002CC3231B|nr:diguanylate cyclase [Sporomusa sp.]HWR06259.1 diguanylate cyclase [Sporomusa sp.]
MKLLIVDDDKIIRRILSSMVQDWGYEVMVAADASEAWNTLFANDEPVIVLMDWIMPDIDGIELCKKIKQAKNEGDTYVIMLTAKNDIEDMVAGFAAGADDFLSKPVDARELGSRLSVGSRVLKYQHTLVQRNAELQATKHVMENIMWELKEANEKLRALTLIDGLTGIANRRSLEEFMDKEWRFAMREQISLTIIMLDVDFFKFYNDTYGHQMGDLCLQKVANVLAEYVKPNGDLAARYGGEEFAVVLRNTDVAAAKLVAENIRMAVERLDIAHSDSPVAKYVTVSLGVSTVIPQPGEIYGKLLDTADKALYQAKNEGRNRWIYISGYAGRGVMCAGL